MGVTYNTNISKYLSLILLRLGHKTSLPMENMRSTAALEGMGVLYLMNNSLMALLGKVTLERVTVFFMPAGGLVQGLEQFILHVMVFVVSLTVAAALSLVHGLLHQPGQ
ncbi:hypothetical protein Hamer_G023190, partial [Homarus americanus]